MTVDEIRELAEEDFISFVKLVAPYNVMGSCHEDICKFLMDKSKKPYKLVIYPRGHRKSFYAAMYACWKIIKDPSIAIVYLSATSPLAESQLRTIKATLESKIVKRYWPEMVLEDEGKREKWTTTEICVDHPRRREEGTRDSTVKTGGLTTNITGSHADLIILDDLVVPANNDDLGRRAVIEQYSQLQSILNAGGEIIAVGTRYHPKDLYATIQDTYQEIYNEAGEVIGREPQWDILQRVVEENGEFLWPRQRRADGKYYGYDLKELARIKAGYIDKTQFYSQYYNDPNDASTSPITPDMFEYYNRDNLTVNGGVYHLNGRPLNVYAAIDFAYSLSAKADNTAIVTVGVDQDNNRYILDIDRFKTDKIQDYYDHIIAVHQKYSLRKLRAECTAAQQIIVKTLKDKLSENSVRLVIDEYKPLRDKEERVLATLKPLYEDHRIFHYRGGNCELLEEEVKQAKPAHDDMKNALADAIDIAVAPRKTSYTRQIQTIQRLGRFGGV